jgi:hypothetical protein
MGGSLAGNFSREPQQTTAGAPKTTSRTPQTVRDWIQLQRIVGNHTTTRLLEGTSVLPTVPTATHQMDGKPLDPATRALMEFRLGHDFSSVRIHKHQSAAQSARRLDAHAFTVGENIVLGATAPSLQTKHGQRLLAHELAHVVQQRRGGSSPSLDPESAPEKNAAAVASAIALGQAPPAISHGTVVGIARQPIEIPKVSEETGIKAEPGPLRPGVLGSAFPLPASITVLKPPGGGRDGWLTAPSFSLRLDPRGLVAGLLDQVSLGGYSLTNPTLVYDVGTDTFTAAGTVSIPTKYPQLDSPTNIAVRIRSSSLGLRHLPARAQPGVGGGHQRFGIQGSAGPFAGELTLDIQYDWTPLMRMWKAAKAGNLGAAAAGAGEVERQARVGFSGSAGIGWPGHYLPLTYAHGSGSVGPSGTSGVATVAGAIALPKGTFHPELSVPAAGIAFGGGSIRRTGTTAGYGFGGITGTPSIQKLLTGDLADGFVPFAYAQVTAIRITPSGHQFSIKISGQYRLGATSEGATPLEQFRADIDAQREAERYETGGTGDFERANIDPHLKRAVVDPAVLSRWIELQPGPGSSTGADLVVTGTFDLLGGK